MCRPQTTLEAFNYPSLLAMTSRMIKHSLWSFSVPLLFKEGLGVVITLDQDSRDLGWKISSREGFLDKKIILLLCAFVLLSASLVLNSFETLKTASTEVLVIEVFLWVVWCVESRSRSHLHVPIVPQVLA